MSVSAGWEGSYASRSPGLTLDPERPVSKAAKTDTRTDAELLAMLKAFRALTVTEQSAYLTEHLWLARDTVARRRAAALAAVRVRGMH